MGQSLEETRAQHIAAMGGELGGLYYSLWGEVADLHFRRRQFFELYVHSKERVDLLNEAAPAFFHDLQQTLWRDMLLHLARLLDRPESRGKANLTLAQLPRCIPDAAFRAEVEGLVKSAEATAGFVPDWRNRRLAHRDLNLTQGRSAAPLPAVSWRELEASLKAVRTVMLAVEEHYLGSSTAFEHGIARLGGADQLMAMLELGIAAHRERLKRLRAGSV